ncbi:DHA1 family multidrug/chloramphenicol efflux transport protein-like MFS transporter [Silvimonas terrae]|uniref:Multidrug transporter MdfA n=1 Tax=Silvimonas terrae TaxID=300266 RepID=A0A840RDE2_9NEIS|nr:MFS transporter [Silvimonas terrae]MBB5190604.1 DHA1 family multidrug/chloramphenicol efflux transport protein-like MFS transporter [Silvimonas terrae]
MQHKPISRLHLGAMLFPLCLVLYEFSTYIANDMILPGMLHVTQEFGVSSAWVPTSMTLYMIGGASLQWLLGPLSDRIGRRPVMLAGVVWFVSLCLAALIAHNMTVFLALRFLQGMGMCFLVAVGYAAIQEAFEEKTAIKVTALMANVALLAPLIGPLTGAALMAFTTWRMIFVAIACLAAVAGVGLYFAMPETAPRSKAPFSYTSVWLDYKAVLTNRRFMSGVMAISMAGLPLLAWIGQSPVIIMEGEHHSSLDYGLWQLPVFGSLILGNIALATIGGRYPIQRVIALGGALVFAGTLLALALTLLFDTPFQGMAIGLGLYAFGLGLGNAGIFRLTLFASDIAKGTVSATLGLIMMGIYAIGIEIFKAIYHAGGEAWFAGIFVVTGLAFVLTLRHFMGWDKSGQPVPSIPAE